MAPKYTDLHRIAITGIIWRERSGKCEFLITRRSLEKKVHPGKWTVPGGGLETNDYVGSPTAHEGQWYHSAETALRREIQEEVGLEVDEVRYLTDVAFIRPDGIPVLVLSYFCRQKSGEATCGEDTIDLAWISASQAGDYDLIDGIAEEIAAVDEILNKEKKVV